MSGISNANLLVYSLQIAILVSAAAIAESACGLPSARVRLAFWRAVLAGCFVLPLLPALAIPTGASRSQAVVSFAVGAQRFGAVEAPIAPLVASLLLAGALARSAWFITGLVGLHRLRRASAPAELSEPVGRAARRIAPEAEFRSHPSIDQPVAFGWRQPVVLLPARFHRLSEPMQLHVASHEAFHVARRDWLHIVVEQLVQIVFWFHPAIRLVADRINLARDQRVDELVVGAGGDRMTYVAALLSFAGIRSAPLVVAPLLRRSHLAARIRALASPRPSDTRTMWTAAAAIVVTAVAAIGATSIRPAPRPSRDTQVYAPGNGVTLPRVVKEVRPDYTDAAKQRRIEGQVLLECVVTKEGVPDQISVVASLDPVYGLDDAAVAAMKQWRFAPGTKGGEPVAVRIQVQMKFTLK